MDTFAELITEANAWMMQHKKLVYGFVPLAYACWAAHNLYTAYKFGYVQSLRRYQDPLTTRRKDSPGEFWFGVWFNAFCLAVCLAALAIPW